MKRIITLLILAAMVLTLCACEIQYNTKTVNCISHSNSTSFSSTYDLFSGKREYTISVPDGQTLDVRIKISTESGKLALTLAKTGSEPEYVGSEIPSSAFTVTLRESGKYNVIIEAEEHRGSYSFDWGS